MELRTTGWWGAGRLLVDIIIDYVSSFAGKSVEIHGHQRLVHATFLVTTDIINLMELRKWYIDIEALGHKMKYSSTTIRYKYEATLMFAGFTTDIFFGCRQARSSETACSPKYSLCYK